VVQLKAQVDEMTAAASTNRALPRNAAAAIPEPWATVSTAALRKHYEDAMAQHAAWDCTRPTPGYRWHTVNSSSEKFKRQLAQEFCSGKARQPWTAPRGLISLTTTPDRIARPEFAIPILSAIESHPTWPVYLVVPVEPARQSLGKFPASPPEWMTNLLEGRGPAGPMGPRDTPRFRVVRVAADRGPTAKLLNIVEALGDVLQPDDRIITIDDDRMYKPKMVRVSIEASEQHPYAIVSHGGKNSFGPSTETLGVLMVPPEPIGKEWHSPGFGNRLQGFGGVLYRRKFITEAWFAPEKVKDECVFEDDTWFSMMAYYSGVPIFIPGIQAGVDGPHAWPQDMKTGLSDGQGKMNRFHKTIECEKAVIKLNDGRKASVRWLEKST